MTWTIANATPVPKPPVPLTPEQAALTAQMERMILGWELLPDAEPDWNRWCQTQEPLSATSTDRPGVVYSVVVTSREGSILELCSASVASPLPELSEDSRLWLVGRRPQSAFRLIGVGNLRRTESARWHMAVEHSYLSQRRRSVRVHLQPPLPVRARIPGMLDGAPLWMLDLSDGGALLRGPAPGRTLPDSFVLDLPVAEAATPLRVPVQVRNRRVEPATEGTLPLFGVRWMEDAKDRLRFRQWRESLVLRQYLEAV